MDLLPEDFLNTVESSSFPHLLCFGFEDIICKKQLKCDFLLFLLQVIGLGVEGKGYGTDSTDRRSVCCASECLPRKGGQTNVFNSTPSSLNARSCAPAPSLFCMAGSSSAHPSFLRTTRTGRNRALLVPSNRSRCSRLVLLAFGSRRAYHAVPGSGGTPEGPQSLGRRKLIGLPALAYTSRRRQLPTVGCPQSTILPTASVANSDHRSIVARSLAATAMTAARSGTGRPDTTLGPEPSFRVGPVPTQVIVQETRMSRLGPTLSVGRPESPTRF